MILEHFYKRFLIKFSKVSFIFLPPAANVSRNCIMLIHNVRAMDQKR